MITTITLNPAIDRNYFVDENRPKHHQFIYSKENIKITPGGKGLITAINLIKLGYQEVQNIAFVGGRQGLFFEKMVHEHNITTNYVYTKNEIRNNIEIISDNPKSNTYYNDYTYEVDNRDKEELIKKLRRSISDSKCILISGSIPEGVGFDIYQMIVKICHDKKKDVFLHASGEALNLALREKPKVVFPYFKHADKILDEEIEKDRDYVRMGWKLIEAGAQNVIMPFHCNRMIFTKEKAYILSPKQFCLENWLGVGDAYNTGFIDYIMRNGFDFIEANRFGGAAALHVAEKKEIFIENRADIEKRTSEIEINGLEETL